jgi:hypothetical protein
MTTRYGIPLQLKPLVHDEVLQLLRDVARRRTLITYSGLAAKVTRFALAPESYALHDLIGDVARSEDAAGRASSRSWWCTSTATKCPARASSSSPLSSAATTTR